MSIKDIIESAKALTGILMPHKREEETEYEFSCEDQYFSIFY